jgi:hypothetical protein
MTAAPDVVVHIERLVLDGVELSRAESESLGASLTAELTRLLTEGRLASGISSGPGRPRPSAPATVELAGGPERLGEQVARAVAAGLQR